MELQSIALPAELSRLERFIRWFSFSSLAFPVQHWIFKFQYKVHLVSKNRLTYTAACIAKFSIWVIRNAHFYGNVCAIIKPQRCMDRSKIWIHGPIMLWKLRSKLMCEGYPFWNCPFECTCFFFAVFFFLTDVHFFLFFFEKNGQGRIRTFDPQVNSLLRCRLRYSTLT